MYSMKVDIDVQSALANAGVDVYVLRDTWDLQGAYKLAMKTYYNTMKEEMTQSSRGRWLDFNVQSGVAADLLGPSVAEEDFNTVGSFTVLPTTGTTYASVADAAGTPHSFTMEVSASANEYSIIDEWRNFGRVSNDPASQSTTLAYAGVSENIDETNYDLLRDVGENPPYSTAADDEIWHKVCTLQAGSDGNQKLSSGFFDAPLGIVILRSVAGFPPGPAVPDVGLTVSFQKGNYKGVKAPAYATPILTEAKEYEVV
jgi:hypothetical protein